MAASWQTLRAIAVGDGGTPVAYSVLLSASVPVGEVHELELRS